MKRDMNLIRLLLLHLEGEEPKPDLSDYSEQQQLYHWAKLIEAGLVLGYVDRDNKSDIRRVALIELTWAGHEFLVVARNETVWNKARGRLAKGGVEIGLPVLQSLLTDLLKEQIGLK